MSRLGFRAAPSAIVISALVLVTGCGRPSADDYAAFEAKLRGEGLLRTETAPEDAPFDADDLVRNFERIALYHEAEITRPSGEGNWESNPLQRWYGPLNYSLFGNAVTQADRTEVALLMDRIARLTGLEIAEADGESNFRILITTPEEREAISAELAQFVPTLAQTFDLWRGSTRLICVANILFSHENKNLIADGIVVIGSETSGVFHRFSTTTANSRC
jgi:hypothetical protein